MIQSVDNIFYHLIFINAFKKFGQVSVTISSGIKTWRYFTELKKEHWELGQIAIKQKRATNENLKKAKAFAQSLKENGMNYVQITELLNKNGFKTSTGKEYLHTSTRRLF